jgi:Pectate lyase superfamily protein
MTNIPFTSYRFKASPGSGGPVDRTLPDRLNDVVNVKDFGATGNGVTDDTDAINAAIDHAYTLGSSSQHAATIFFPPGTYIVGKGGTVQLFLDRDGRTLPGGRGAWLKCMGAGRDVSILKGVCPGGPQLEEIPNGMLFHCNRWGYQVNTICDLTFWNTSTDSTSGAFMQEQGGAQQSITNCHFRGVIGLYAQQVSFGQKVSDCLFTSTRPITVASAASRSPFFTYDNFQAQSGSPAHSNQFGSVGVYMGQGMLVNCTATGFDIGFVACGTGMTVVGCKAYRCGIGITDALLGGDPSASETPGGDPVPGFGYWRVNNGYTFQSNWIDRCTWGIHLWSSSGGFVAANRITGTEGPNDAAAISGITFSSLTATVTTVDDHNLPAGPSDLALVTNPAGWTPLGTGDEIVTCTRTGARTFTYALASDPGSFASATWNYPIEYGITLRHTETTMYVANVLDARASVASFDILHVPSHADGFPTYDHNVCAATRGQYGWSLSDGTRLPAWKFVQCDTGSGITFATLPDGFPQKGPLEGMEFTVTDCSTQNTFGGTVTGGGSNHYKVRYNGTKWIRVG